MSQANNNDALQVAVAKGVESLLKTHDFGLDVAIERGYAEWPLDLTADDALAHAALDKTDPGHPRIDVVSHTTEQEHGLASRGELRFDLPIDIAVRQKLSATEQDAASGLVNIEAVDRLCGIAQAVLVKTLMVRLPASSLPPESSAVWHPEKGSRVLVCPNRDHLRDLRQFTAIVRVHFRAALKVKQPEA